MRLTGSLLLFVVAGSLPMGCGSSGTSTRDASTGLDSSATLDSSTAVDSSTGSDAAGDTPQASSSLLTDDAGRPLPMLDAPVERLADMVDVAGIVRDATAGTAIAGATVRVGTVAATTNAEGRFALSARRGHALLDVRAGGHASMIRQIGLDDRLPPFEIRLAPFTSTASVGPDGHAFARAAGGALEIPRNAYPTATTISVTFIDDVEAMSGDVFFGIDGSRAARVLNVVDVHTSVEPRVPATLRLPVPAGVDPAKLALYTLDDATGTWTERVLPTSVAGGIATYSVSHFSHRAQVEEGNNSVAIVTRCMTRLRYSSDGLLINGRVCFPGLQIRSGDSVRTNGHTVEMQTSNGGRVALGGTHTDFRMLKDDPLAENTVEATCVQAPCSMRLLYNQLRGQKPSPRRPFGVRPRNQAVMGVRGTVFSLDSNGCPSSAPGSERAAGDVTVSAGSVDVQIAGAARTLDAGSRLRVCLGCRSLTEPACCHRYDSQPPCGQIGGGPIMCQGPASTTWVCDDLHRYVCIMGGSCTEPPGAPGVLAPITCAGNDECPITVPLCRTMPSSGVYTSGTCMPEEPIAQYGWDQFTVPVDAIGGLRSGTSAGGADGGSGSGSGDAGGGVIRGDAGGSGSGGGSDDAGVVP